MITKPPLLGILGGMGPYATLKFWQHLLELTPAKNDAEHYRMIIDNNPSIPNRIAAVMGLGVSPVSVIAKSINNLQHLGVNIVAVPCNAVHYYHAEITTKINIPWLNMLELVADFIKPQFNRPLILGSYITTNFKLYQPYLPDAQYLSTEDNNFVAALIDEIKLTASITVEKQQEFIKLISSYQKIDCLLLGCTELSFLLNPTVRHFLPIFDSSYLYAKAIINFLK